MGTISSQRESNQRTRREREETTSKGQEARWGQEESKNNTAIEQKEATRNKNKTKRKPENPYKKNN